MNLLSFFLAQQPWRKIKGMKTICLLLSEECVFFCWTDHKQLHKWEYNRVWHVAEVDHPTSSYDVQLCGRGSSCFLGLTLQTCTQSCTCACAQSTAHSWGVNSPLRSHPKTSVHVVFLLPVFFVCYVDFWTVIGGHTRASQRRARWTSINTVHLL